MKLLTDKQNDWLRDRTIKVGDVCSIPTTGFPVYETDALTGMEWIEGIDINQMRAGLFRILDENDKCYKITLASKPNQTAVYIPKAYLEVRSLIEFCVLWVICIVPFVIYNLFTK